jgi:hypothetical protein
VISKQDVPRRIAEILGRPARWASAGRAVGSYDGCERTVEVFDAPLGEQLGLLRALRAERAVLEPGAGGPLVVLFHTPSETRRLYGDVLDEMPRRIRYGEVAKAFGRWLAADQDGAPEVTPEEIERFSFGEDRAA